MRKTILNKKRALSITLDPKIINIINDNFSNKSKFIENCLIDELCKNKEFKSELKKLKIIL